jgi:pyrroloquinoline quinone biosynthesis protein B
MMPSIRKVTFVTLLCALLPGSIPGNAIADAEHPYLYVLGITQDAGYPQAGCYRPHCMPGWKDRGQRLTASSVALINPASATKHVFDATPHLPDQLYRLEQEAPGDQYRLGGFFLTHAHIGHYTGLMHLGREVMGAMSVPVFAMPRMKRFLENNGPWSQLVTLSNIRIAALADREAVSLSDDLRVTPFLVPHRDEFSETVGYRIDGPNRSAVFIPDIDKWHAWDEDIVDLVRDVDYALLDASFYADGEIPGRAMSEIPHPFVTESMQLFEQLHGDERAKVIFIHINHTNPILNQGSSEYREVIERGYRIAFEGMRLPL